MLSELIAYSFGKRRARKQQQRLTESLVVEEDNYIEAPLAEDWSCFDQDIRSLEELLQKARENSANKNN